MMNAVEGSGHSFYHMHGSGMFPGKGLHLGHMHGTAEGPPGQRPDQAETENFVEAAGEGDVTDTVKSRLSDELATVFDKADGDSDGALTRAEFYNLAEVAFRDGVGARLAEVIFGGGAGGDGGDDDAVGGAAPPAADDGANGAPDVADEDPTGGVANSPAPEAAVDENIAPPVIPLAAEIEEDVAPLVETPEAVAAESVAPAVAAPEVATVATPPEVVEEESVAPQAAPEVVLETGDPVFDLTLSSIIENFAVDTAGAAALALVEAAQGYLEASEAA